MFDKKREKAKVEKVHVEKVKSTREKYKIACESRRLCKKVHACKDFPKNTAKIFNSRRNTINM